MAEQKEPRQETMTSAERMGALFMRQRPDRLPFMPFAGGFCAVNVGYPVHVLYSDPERSFWAQMWTAEMYGYDGGAIFGYASQGGWEFGGEIKMPKSEWEQAPVVTRFPAQTPEEVDALEIPDVETAGIYPLAIQFAKIQQQFGMPIFVQGMSPFTSAGNIAEVDVLCRWLVKQPEVAHKLLRKVNTFGKKVIDYYVEHFPNYPIIAFTAEPTGANQIISPKQFEEFVLPYYQELHNYILSSGIRNIFCHICGEQNLNLPYWAQIEYGDPGILSFGHEVDLEKVVELFGDKHIVAGNVEPQVIQNGTNQQVYELCKVCIEKAKYAPNGYILMAGCEVPVQAPPYNFYVMKKAVMDHGFYD
jgi:uroporphyrinogen decarboxylase